MSRFFVNQTNIHADFIDITGEDVIHIKKVLRLRQGDSIIVSDGKGYDYTVEIAEFGQTYIRTAIIQSNLNTTEPPIDITLFQGLPKSDKMDFIIQKSVELGVKRIIPIITERTVVKITSTKDAENKAARWQRISIEAAKQCNRGIVPEIKLPMNYDDMLKVIDENDLGIIPYERETDNSLRGYISNNRSAISRVAVMIGSEGGFTEEEVTKAVSCGLKPVTLGPRILRTETAGIAVLSILMYELGDVGR